MDIGERQLIVPQRQLRIARAQLNRLQRVLGSVVGPTKKDLDLTNIVVGNRKVGIKSNCTFEGGQGLREILVQPFQYVAAVVNGDRVVRLDGERLVHDGIEFLEMLLAGTGI